MNENEKNMNEGTAEIPEKKNIAEEYNKVFDHNIDPAVKPVNREYIQRIFGEDMPLKTDEIRMTRTSYAQEYAEIISYFKKERGTYKKSILVAAAAFIVLYVLRFCFSQLLAIGLNIYLAAILNGFKALLTVFMFAIPIVIIMSIIKKLRQINKAEKHALESLEQRKEECMLLGVYDAGR